MPPKPRKEAACLVLLMSKELAKEVVEAYYDLDDAFHHLPGEDEGDTFGVTAGLASMDPREAGSVASFQAHARDVARDSRGFPPHASLVEQTKAHMARKHQGWDAGGIGINPNMRAYLSSHGNLLANVPQDQVLLSIIEYPTPEWGYPNLDVEGLAVQVKVKAPADGAQLLRALQKRLFEEAGLVLPMQLFELPCEFGLERKFRTSEGGKGVTFVTACVPKGSEIALETVGAGGEAGEIRQLKRKFNGKRYIRLLLPDEALEAATASLTLGGAPGA